jgi:hypothetical protein
MRMGPRAVCSFACVGTDMRAHHIDWRGRAGWTQSAEDAAYYKAHPVG